MAPLGRPARSGAALTLAVGALVLVLGIAEVAVRFVPSTWIQRDGRFYTNVNVTLVEGASIEQREFAASWYGGELGWNRNLDESWSNVSMGARGERLPKHSVLMPLLATPLFWAFGLTGTLMFNLLMFGVIGGAGFAVARRRSSHAAAMVAGLGLALATGVRDHAYDYHIDILILALFVAGMAALDRKRGGWAGLLLGMTVVLRPTLLLWMPPLALMSAAARDWRTLGRTVLFGAIPLVLFALTNWWLYGAPWLSAYNRVLVVVNGEAQVADVGDAFSVPLEEGLRGLWEGPFGVRHRLTLIGAAIPGLLLLTRRRPSYVLAAVLGVGASIYVFAQYRWYGDRFLWPSCALLVPALAASFDGLTAALRRWPRYRLPLIAALGTMALVAVRGTAGVDLEARLADSGWQELAQNLAIVGALAFGLARAGERAAGRALGLLAPLALFVLPDVAPRALEGGPDLYLAAALSLALGARSWPVSLVFAGLVGYVVATAPEASLGLSLDRPSDRPAWILGLLAVFGLPRMKWRAWLVAPLGLLLIDRVETIADGRWPLFALALLCLPVIALAGQVGGVAAHWHRAASTTQRALGIGSVLAALFVAGLVPRMLDDGRLHIATYRGVRTARVSLGEVPCDFLAWEHLNWECSTLDQGVYGETGLATSQPLMVAGRDAGLFLISTQRGRPRKVRWDDVPADGQLALRYAIPDGERGGGTLKVRVDGEELASLTLPASSDGEIHRHAIDTRAFAGRAVALELELSGPNVVIGVDGGFEAHTLEGHGERDGAEREEAERGDPENAGGAERAPTIGDAVTGTAEGATERGDVAEGAREPDVAERPLGRRPAGPRPLGPRPSGLRLVREPDVGDEDR